MGARRIAFFIVVVIETKQSLRFGCEVVNGDSSMSWRHVSDGGVGGTFMRLGVGGLFIDQLRNARGSN